MSQPDGGGDLTCPYCAQSFWLAVDRFGGRDQRLISDCEICCQPIEIHAHFDEEGRLTLDATTS